jgi:predicted O-methyltransferase YrrM
VIESGPKSGTPRRGDAPVPSSPAAGTPAPVASTAPAAPDLGAWIGAWQPEDTHLQAARQRAREVGVAAVDEATGAALRVLAALSGARHAVELGTGAGVSTLWLLGGLHPDGVLTSIDAEPEHQRLARQSLTEARVPSGRVRLIAGRALEVLPRLQDGGYDLVLCDAASAEAVDYLPAALRLLRLGGVVVFTGALASGRIADPTARDPEVLAARELARAVREEPRLVPALVPVGAGLLVAVTREDPAGCA